MKTTGKSGIFALAFSLSILTSAYAQAQGQSPQPTAPVASVSSSQGKIAIINIQMAIANTREGREAAQKLQNQFEPKRKELEALQAEIQQLREKLRRGANTMSEDARQKLLREIDDKTKELQRKSEDAQAEFNREQQKILQELGGRMMQVIDKYARDNGYVLIFDVSDPDTSILYAANQLDITQDIIRLYDQVTATSSAQPSGGSTQASSQQGQN